MLPIILEQVNPRNDDFLRLKREELWIRNYQSVEFGANKHFWRFQAPPLFSFGFEISCSQKVFFLFLQNIYPWIATLNSKVMWSQSFIKRSFEKTYKCKPWSNKSYIKLSTENSRLIILKQHTGSLPPQICSGSKNFTINLLTYYETWTITNFGGRCPVCNQHSILL